MALGDRIKQARNKMSLTQEQLAKLINVSKGTIGNYEIGISSPNEDSLIKLMKTLGVDANFLYQDEMADALACVRPESASDVWHRPLVTAYKAADVPVRQSACRVLDIDYVDPEQPGIPDNVIRLQEALDGSREIPVKTIPTAAGAGIYVEDESELRTFPLSIVPDSADCGILISGNSMEPDIANGDIVWVHETPTIDNHQVGVFIVNRDEAVCKRAKFDDRGRLVWLMSDNPKVPDIRVRDLEECRVFGRVVGVYHER